MGTSRWWLFGHGHKIQSLSADRHIIGQRAKNERRLDRGRLDFMSTSPRPSTQRRLAPINGRMWTTICIMWPPVIGTVCSFFHSLLLIWYDMRIEESEREGRLSNEWRETLTTQCTATHHVTLQALHRNANGEEGRGTGKAERERSITAASRGVGILR